MSYQIDKCDFCGAKQPDEIYDAETKFGPWAYMCKACWKKHGKGVLGLGHGQRYKKLLCGVYELQRH